MSKISTLVLCFAALACTFPAAAADLPVTQAPAGVTTTYTREAEGFILSNMGVSASVSEKGTYITETADGDVYILNPFSTVTTGTYLKGQRDGEKIKVELPQLVMLEDEDGTVYEYYAHYMELLVTPEGKYSYLPTFDYEEFSYTCSGDKITLDIENTNEGLGLPPSVILGLTDEEGYWVGFGDYKQVYTVFDQEPQCAPEGLETDKWRFSYGATSKMVNIGFDGGDVWVQGISSGLPDAWVRGSLSGDKIIFESRQYLGIEPVNSYQNFFFGGFMQMVYDPAYGADVLTPMPEEEIYMTYDSKARTISGEDECSMFVSAKQERLFVLEEFRNVSFNFVGEVQDFTPMTPLFSEFEAFNPLFGTGCIGFTLPATNTAGQPLDTKDMYYTVYFDGEPFTFLPAEYMGLKAPTDKIPYTLTTPTWDIYAEGELHYVYFFFDGFATVGVRSFFTDAEGNVHGSETMTYDVASGSVLTGVDVAGGCPEAVSVTYTNLSGMPVVNPGKGMYIMTTIYSDGSRKTRKVAFK